MAETWPTWGFDASVWGSSLGATVSCGGAGDSLWDNGGGGLGDHDLGIVPAGVTLLKKGIEYSTTGVTLYPATPGMDPYIIAWLLDQPGVSAVQLVSRAVTGARWSSISETQVEEVISDWETHFGYDYQAPVGLDFFFIWGMTNDLAANGEDAAGEFSDGTPLTRVEVIRRCLRVARRIRMRRGFANTRIVFLLPVASVDDYPDADNVRDWIEEAAALIGNCVALRLPLAVLADKQHIQQDHPTGGYDYITSELGAVLTP